jgi:hypothetical protein
MPDAQARRAETQRRNNAAARLWNPSDQPDWLTPQVYAEQIQPRLAHVKLSMLRAALRVSEPYAVNVRAGRRCPHPRHWLALAQLVGVSGPDGIPTDL